MVKVKVLGPGCAKCHATARLVESVAHDAGVAIELEKVEDVQAIARYGILATPGVVIDGAVVHAGGMPRRDSVEAWLKGAGAHSAPG